MRPYTEILDTLTGMDLPIVKDNKKIEYYNIECGFDIETTSINQDDNKVAFMYIWQIGIGYGNDVFYGRTWNEFLDCLEIISDHLELSEFKRLVIYVHNLGYEFQFMRKYFDWLNVFAVKERKPIRALNSLGIEFRDSLILSAASLAITAKNLAKIKIDKMVGDLDYSLVRTHETPLTDQEIKYCINDIQIILAYINEQIEYCGDITRIPMTNTGRVRSYVRKNCYYVDANGDKAGKGQYIRYRNVMSDLTIDVDTYIQLKNAFMGGFTHANANYSGKVLKDVTSIDFTSSYPSVMVSEKFPMSRFKKCEVKSINQLDMMSKKFALVFEAKFINIRSKISQENYISESKCRNLSLPVINNGRIASAELLTVTLTEIDYDIMKNCYEWDMLSVGNVKFAHKDYLPKAICQSILKIYQDKTELKDVEGFETEYLISKGMLNSIYGMSVTDVVKNNSVYDNDLWQVETPNTLDEIEKYNESKNRFLYYAWGIWVTAYARRNLWTGILATGDDYVYSDTDSLKVLNYEKHKPYIKHFDNQIIKKMKAMCSHYKFDEKLLNPKTKKGVHKMLGVWDYEGTYNRFKTLGAKRYLYENNGKLELTVAGLSKQNGLKYMVKKYDNDINKVFDMFDDNLTIPSNETGKNSHSYIDEPQSVLVEDYLGKKTEVHTLSGLHLENCSFTLSMSSKYLEFLQQLSSGYIYKGNDFI